MKILFDKRGRVDLGAPVYMDEEYFKEFCNFLSQLLNEEVEVVHVTEKERYPPHSDDKDKVANKGWSADELHLLLQNFSAEDLERS